MSIEIETLDRDVIEILEPVTKVEVSEPKTTVVVEDDDGSIALLTELEVSTVEVQAPRTLTIERTVVEIVELGVEGPQGPSGTNRFLRTAAVIVSGHRIVVARADGAVEYADNTLSLRRAPWLTTRAALANDIVEVLALGELIEPSWAWIPGEPLYLGSNGLMTQTPPLAPAFLLELGVALTPTSIFYDPKMPIALT